MHLQWPIILAISVGCTGPKGRPAEGAAHLLDGGVADTPSEILKFPSIPCQQQLLSEAKPGWVQRGVANGAAWLIGGDSTVKKFAWLERLAKDGKPLWTREFLGLSLRRVYTSSDRTLVFLQGVGRAGLINPTSSVLIATLNTASGEEVKDPVPQPPKGAVPTCLALGPEMRLFGSIETDTSRVPWTARIEGSTWVGQQFPDTGQFTCVAADPSGRFAAAGSVSTASASGSAQSTESVWIWSNGFQQEPVRVDFDPDYGARGIMDAGDSRWLVYGHRVDKDIIPTCWAALVGSDGSVVWDRIYPKSPTGFQFGQFDDGRVVLTSTTTEGLARITILNGISGDPLVEFNLVPPVPSPSHWSDGDALIHVIYSDHRILGLGGVHRFPKTGSAWVVDISDRLLPAACADCVIDGDCMIPNGTLTTPKCVAPTCTDGAAAGSRK